MIDSRLKRIAQHDAKPANPDLRQPQRFALVHVGCITAMRRHAAVEEEAMIKRPSKCLVIAI